jgi:LysR family transcriptional regulator, benzoate and cis,cis-muconate-responsive activator of ben and cat genes
MEIRQLRYFVTVADEGSFTGAARRLHVSQPPISRQISLLERELGVMLFERVRPRVRLTDAGRAFYRQARAALGSVESAAVAARRASEGEVGKISLGLGGLVAYLLPEVVARFRARHRAVELVLHPLNLAEQYEAVLNDVIDFGLVVLPIENEGIVTELFRREPLMAVLPPSHPLCAQPRLHVEDLAPHEFVLFPWARGYGFGRLVMRVCSRAGFVPRVVQEAWPTESILGMVGAGVGISILPAMAQRQQVANVEYRPLSERFAAADIAMAWKRTNDSRTLRRFVEVARECRLRRRH